MSIHSGHKIIRARTSNFGRPTGGLKDNVSTGRLSGAPPGESVREDLKKALQGRGKAINRRRRASSAHRPVGRNPQRAFVKSLRTGFRLIPRGAEEAPPVNLGSPAGHCSRAVHPSAPASFPGEKPETGAVHEPRLRRQAAHALPGSSGGQPRGRAPAAKKQLVKE